MNILNKGRCNRCLASTMKEKIIKLGNDGKPSKVSIWKYCKKYNKYCRYCSSKCKESPMGIKV